MPDLPGQTQKGRWIFGIFSDADGSASFGAVGSFIALCVVIVWGSFLIWKNHVMPGLGDPAIFVSTPFGLHKAEQAVRAFGNSNKGNGQ